MNPSTRRLVVRPARLAASGLAVCAVLALASCSPESRVLARVGSRTITAGEFSQVASTAGGQYPFLPDSAKHLLLEDLIRRSLMLQEAERTGVTKDTLMGSLRRNAEDDLLLGALTEALAPNHIPVSEAELATFYDWHKLEYRVQVIYAADPVIAKLELAQIRAGRPFEDVARHFNAGSPVPPDGNLGFAPGGAMPEPLDSQMRAAAIGEVLGPMKIGGDAWFLARVLERREADLPPREQIGDQLRQQLVQRKHRAQIQRVLASLREAYGLRLEPGGAQALFAQARGMTPDSATSRPDAQTVLARYTEPGGERTYTLADANQEIQGLGEPPNYNSVSAIERWIESRAIRRIVLAEARRRHLEEEPANVRRIQDRVDGAVLQTIYDREVSMNAQVSDAELRAEYERRGMGQGTPPFDQVPVGLREQLRSMAMENKREALLQAFNGKLRAQYPVTVDESLLRRLPWPLPAADHPQG